MAALKFQENSLNNGLKELILVGLQVTGRWSANLFRNSLFTSNYPCHFDFTCSLTKIFILDRRLRRTNFSTNKSFPSDPASRNVIENIFSPLKYQMLFLNIKALKVSFFCRIAYSHITHCSYIPHICSSRKTLAIYKHCTKKKFSIKDLFNKYDQIRKKLQIWSNLLEEILNEKLWFFCAVKTVISFS